MKHAIAHLRWRSQAEGGLRTPFTASRYARPVIMEGTEPSEGGWTLVVHRSRPEARTEETVLVHFLMEAAPHDLLTTGRTFQLLEGPKVVAEGVVEEVFELKPAFS